MCTMLAQVLERASSSWELPHFSSFRAPFERKIISNNAISGAAILGPSQIFVLDEKSGQIHVISQDKKTNEDCNIRLFLTPAPSMRISSILLSPCNKFLALICRKFVYVIDCVIRHTGVENSQDQLIRPIYCALDLSDFRNSHKLSREIIRVRWHPKKPGILVILTSTPSVYFVSCSKASGKHGLICSLVFELNLRELPRDKLDPSYENHGHCRVHSDNENSISPSDSMSRLDFDFALGAACVDFDFGSCGPCPLTNRNRNIESLDCFLYLLYETGDIVEVYGCLSVEKPTQLYIAVLSILPPSADNYGDDFCSLMAFRSSDLKDSCGLLNSVPDILVLASNAGCLYQGVVIRSAVSNTKTPQTSLCLVDIVDLQLAQSSDMDPASPQLNRENGQTDDHLFKSLSTLNICGSSMPLMSLEPAFATNMGSDLFSADPSFGLSSALIPETCHYNCQGYYAIHHMGIHFIHLPWLANISNFCSTFANDYISPTANKTDEDISVWHSYVKHIVCGHVKETNSDQPDMFINQGKFRLAGLIEMPEFFSSTNQSDTMLHGQSTTAQLLPNMKSLLIIRAPIKLRDSKCPTSYPPLMQHVNLSLSHCLLEYQCRKLTKIPSINETSQDNSSSQQISKKSNSPSMRSEFTLHLTRLFTHEDLNLPLISAFISESGFSEKQLIKFFIKISDTLRTGPLDRLTKARAYVEQYTNRLSDIITTQYNEVSKLSAQRQILQAEAEKLAARHEILVERQAMLDRRLASLANRLTILSDGPTKAEIAMRDEVTAIQDRLQKGLREWLSNIRSRQCALEKRLEEYLHAEKKAAQLSTYSVEKFNPSLANDQWASVSDTLRQEMTEIKKLVDTVKLLNIKAMNVT